MDCSSLIFSLMIAVTRKTELLFYRSGWPKETFDLNPGSTAVLSCNQIGFNGDAKNAPPTQMRWFKDGKLIRSVPGKTKIFGMKRKPLIEGTRLSLSHLNKTDAGVYTCKLSLRKSSIPDYILSMNFTVKLKKTKQDSQIPKFYFANVTQFLDHQSSSADQERTLLIAITTSAVCLIIVLILTTCLYKKTNFSRCKQTSKTPEHNSNELDVVFSLQSANIASKEAPIKTRNAECIAVFPESRRLKLSHEVDEEPKYVNIERYKDYFPFIEDNEWEMLERSQISRSRVSCQVEHAMPVVLGTGNFGQVYQGELVFQDGTARNVAVKKLNDGCKTKELGHFLKEAVTLLKAGYHPNVISLIGCVLIDSLEDLGIEHETKKPPILLMEVAGEGNLKAFLHSRRYSESENVFASQEIQRIDEAITNDQFESNIEVGKNLSLKNLTSFVYQAAKGMRHLANKKIVHRDLAARNVLLTSDYVIKIADFGLSKHMRELQQEYYRMHSPSITPAKWTAPEALSENVFSIKSDVWSFGILTWEIFTMGKAPYLGVPMTQLYRHLAAGKRLEKPGFAVDSAYRMMQQCWRWEASQRPNFDELVNFFDKSLLAVSEPYLELHGREDSFTSSASCRSRNESDTLTKHGTTIVFDCDNFSADSIDSGRSSDTVFTFSSCDVTDDINTHLERKILEINELINPGYGISDH